MNCDKDWNDEVDDHDFPQTSYDGLWGDSLEKMRDKLVFKRRNRNAICIYCGMMAESREHCPPKHLLTEPFPDNLRELPACYKCNNGFSGMENKMGILIKEIEKQENKGEFEHFELADVENIYLSHTLPFYAEKVLRKTAVGHAIYCTSFGIDKEDYENKETISFVLKSQCSKEEWNCLFTGNFCSVIPELGSRSWGDLYVVEMSNLSTGFFQNCIVSDWKVVQDGVYRYNVSMDSAYIIVRMVLREVLYVEVSFAV